MHHSRRLSYRQWKLGYLAGGERLDGFRVGVELGLEDLVVVLATSDLANALGVQIVHPDKLGNRVDAILNRRMNLSVPLAMRNGLTPDQAPPKRMALLDTVEFSFDVPPDPGMDDAAGFGVRVPREGSPTKFGRHWGSLSR
jgi:hypothetical protein